MAILKISLAGFVLALAFVPLFSMAQGLVPCGYADNPCDTGDVADFVNGMISFLISILGILAVIVLVYVGFRMVTSMGNVSEWEKSKEMFANVVIGIVLILAAWLIIDTLLRGLTGNGLDVWGTLGGTEPTSAVVPAGGDVAAGVSAGQYTDAEARTALSAAGITVWESAPGRTQLGGINQSTLNEAIRLRQACGCPVTVTGGTESGHAAGTYSHGSGYKIDLDDSTALTNHIKNNYTQGGRRSDGATLYTDPSRPGVEYALEGDHWDITVR